MSVGAATKMILNCCCPFPLNSMTLLNKPVGCVSLAFAVRGGLSLHWDGASSYEEINPRTLHPCVGCSL